MIVIGTATEVCPRDGHAGSHGRPGAVAGRKGHREGVAKAVGMLTVPFTVPTPSVALAGIDTVNGGKAADN